MAYRKSTLRSMSPVTRKVARLIGEQESVAKRFKNLIPELQRLELDSRALANAKQVNREAVTLNLAGIKSLSSLTYKEIHNVEAINHTMTVINDYASKAQALLSPPQPQCFTVNSKDLFDESKNPGLSLSPRDILANPNIPKHEL